MFDEIRIVRASVCVRVWNARDGSCGIMRVCATWPSDSPGPRKRLEDLRPHDGVEWESGRSLVQASWDFAVRVIYVWMREQWCNIWWDEMGWDWIVIWILWIRFVYILVRGVLFNRLDSVTRKVSFLTRVRVVVDVECRKRGSKVIWLEKNCILKFRFIWVNIEDE